MLALLHRWENSGDAELLAQPATRVYFRGDVNLLNWLHDGDTTQVVDFEFSGFSDVAVDAADHIEHISARAIPDDLWTDAEAVLGVTADNRARFDAAQRTIQPLVWTSARSVAASMVLRLGIGVLQS